MEKRETREMEKKPTQTHNNKTSNKRYTERDKRNGNPNTTIVLTYNVTQIDLSDKVIKGPGIGKLANKPSLR